MTDYYVRDVDFASAHNALQAPVLLAWVAASRGFMPPDPRRPFTYCDLGCGNGRTLAGLAAVHPDSRFVGIDFNADHVEQARDLASASSLANVEVHLAPFDELASLRLPPFDFIAMNGIYSWLHPRVVEAVTRFLEGNLAPNGLFVVEYLTLPGAAAIAPMWKVMREVTAHVEGGPVQRAARGLESLAHLRQHNARYFIDNPRQSGHIEQLQAHPEDEGLLRWLAHSSLADNWHPKYFTDVSRELGAAGLAFAGSAHLAMNDIELAIPPALRGMFEELREEGPVELLKDFILNRSQRTDVFARRAVPDPALANQFRDDAFCVAACGPTEQVAAALARTGRAVAKEEKTRCLALASQLSGAERPTPVGQLEEAGRPLTQLLVTGLFHVYSGTHPPPAIQPDGPGRWHLPLALNRLNLEQAATGFEPLALVIGNGGCVRLSGLEAVVLDAYTRCEDDAARVDRVTVSIRNHAGQIHVDGQVTTSDWITPTQIEHALHDFEARRLPALMRLGIVAPQKSGPPATEQERPEA